VCTQYSLHVAGVAPQCEGLEMQFDESPLYEALVMQGLPLLVDGAIAVPSGPGLGLALDETRLAAHPYQPVPLGIESIGPH
jgi:L-alanine-DL-glutamate epimerase-like enolase superfamily enzyme